MSRVRAFILGALALLGALIASIAASRKDDKALSEEETAETLRRNNRLRDAAAHEDQARELRDQAKSKRQDAERRIKDAAKRDESLAAVVDRFNSGVRERSE